MRPFHLAVTCLALITPIASGCSASPPQEDAESVEDGLRRLALREIIGTIAYGQTLGPLPYSERPLYRALKFVAAKGDNVDVWVRSTGGDARAWLTNSTFARVASNDDAAPGQRDSHVVYTTAKAGEFYIVWREKNREDASFEVALSRGPVLPVPSVPGPVPSVPGPVPSAPGPAPSVPPAVGAPPFTPNAGVYSLSGSCFIVGGGNSNGASTLVVTVSTQPDGTSPMVVINTLNEPTGHGGGFFRLPLAGNLTEAGGLLGQWSYTEVGGLVRKTGTLKQQRDSANNYSLLLQGSIDIGSGPSVMNCAFGFGAPFVPRAPVTLAQGVRLGATGMCSVVETYPYSCVPGTPGRNSQGCCENVTTVSTPDTIAFQVDAASSTRSLRVLQAPTNAPNVAGLVVNETGGAFDQRPSLYASTVQQAFTIGTFQETNEAIQCGTRKVTRSCSLVHVP